jgi:hypothetical protein
MDRRTQRKGYVDIERDGIAMGAATGSGGMSAANASCPFKLRQVTGKCYRIIICITFSAISAKEKGADGDVKRAAIDYQFTVFIGGNITRIYPDGKSLKT